MTHFAINDLILFLAQMLVDMALVVKVKKELRAKKATVKSTMKKRSIGAQKKLTYLSHIANETRISYSFFIFFYFIYNKSFRVGFRRFFNFSKKNLISFKNKIENFKSFLLKNEIHFLNDRKIKYHFYIK